MKNPGIRRKRLVLPEPHAWAEAIRAGDRVLLSRAITLTESARAQDRTLSEQLIQLVLPYTGKSVRIGITGVPGVGKSTFIDTLGTLLTTQGHKVAVLAVDPSSPVSGGSILGDKTRMEQLASDPKAFIRPTAAGETLGGVAARTRETILLCEAAGFDVILVETVGVGQSETLVHGMTDFFLLLMLPGAGDELQGMKKGIVEMADLLVIHKSDGDNLLKARIARKDYQHALHLLPARENGWNPDVYMASSISKTGISDIWESIQKFEKQTLASGHFNARRAEQALDWYEQTLKELVLTYVYSHPALIAQGPILESEVRQGKINPVLAARQIFESILNASH